MSWRDLTPEIRQLYFETFPRYKLAALIARDPAAFLVGIDLDANTLVTQYDGEMTTKTAGVIAGLSGSFSRITDQLPLSERFLIVKRAAWRIKDVAQPLSNGFHAMQAAIGGPNSLTTTLVGGALGAGAGYLGGRVLNAVVPRAARALLPRKPFGATGPDRDEIFTDETNLAPLMMTAGAALGAAPGLVRGYTALRNGQSPLSAYPWQLNPEFAKAAETAGAMFVPSIPVDAFNRAIWNDAAPNPFGTKSRWGDNDQPLHTPPNVATLTSGLVAAAGASRNSDMVSPWDIASVASNVMANGAMGAVYGSAGGLLAGKVLGALAGLSPAAQEYAQQTGLWAGALTGVTKALF